ncbi:hypothetical protein BsWGS_14528 [Bradybaena similaris]
MEDSRMLIHLVEGNSPNLDDVFDNRDHVDEFSVGDETSEGGVINAVLPTSLSSESASNMLAGRVVAVSLEARVAAAPQLQLCSVLADIASTIQPDMGSTRELPRGTVLGLSNNSALDSNLTPDSNLTSSWSADELGAVVVISLIVPFILLSNIVVVLCVMRFRRLHTPTNYFITSLAAVDIFVALATPFVVVVEVFRFGDVAAAGDVMLCLLPNRILMMGCSVSVLTLATIAYDRHTALVSPLRYASVMTARRVGGLVLLSWLYSLLVVWLPLMAGWYDVPSDGAPCSANLIQWKAPVLFLSAIFIPSCIAIMVCYFRILMVARQHVKAIAAFEFAVQRRVRVKCMMRDTKCAKTLALIIGVFLALWLPYLLLTFMKAVSFIKFDVWLQTYLILLAVFNSGINPWMYAFMNSELRAAFRRLFREVCGHRFCASTDTRASLVSAVSSTPRLSLADSRTPRPSLVDSRTLSIIPHTSLDVNCSQKHLELCAERQSVQALFGQRRHSHTQVNELDARALFVDWRQTGSSCTTLDNLDDGNTFRAGSLKRTRSVVWKHALRQELAQVCVLHDRDLNTSRLYHQTLVPTPDCLETLNGLDPPTASWDDTTSLPGPRDDTTSLPCPRDDTTSLPGPRDDTTSLSTPSGSRAPCKQQCVSMLSQQRAQLPPTLSPCCAPGVQTSPCLPSPTVSCPASSVQDDNHEHRPPPSCRQLYFTDSKQSSSSHVKLSAPSSSHIKLSAPSSSHIKLSAPSSSHIKLSAPSGQQPASLLTRQQVMDRPCTDTARPPVQRRYCDIFINDTLVTSCESTQTSADCRTCSSPRLSPCSSPRLSPCSAPRLSPCSSPGLSPCSAPGLSPCSPPRLSPCSSPRLSPCSSPRLSPCSFPRLSPCSSPRLSPCSSPRLSPCSSPRLSPCSAPELSPFSAPGMSICSAPGLSPYFSSGLSPCSSAGLSSAQSSANNQFCGMFSHVPAYNFLLPLCETLALDVISAAARLENCLELLAAQPRTLIQ